MAARGGPLKKGDSKMTHADAGHYAAKHPHGTALNTTIANAIEKKASDGGLTCAAAHAIAEKLEVAPIDVGRSMDLMEIRLTKCQLGLFGYTPQKKIVTPAETVSPDLEAAIVATAKNGRLACDRAWQMAADQGLTRMVFSAACEALGIKVKPCQLGAF
jgi:hypothetical protein